MSALYDYGVLKMQTEKYYFIPVSRCLKNFLCVLVITTQATLHDWLARMSKQDTKPESIQAWNTQSLPLINKKRRVSELHNALFSNLSSWHIELEFVTDQVRLAEY